MYKEHELLLRELRAIRLAIAKVAFELETLREALVMKEETGFREAVSEVFGYGFPTVAVFDLDGSLSESMWADLKEQGDIIPCSFTGKTKGKRFEELGFERSFTVPE